MLGEKIFISINMRVYDVFVVWHIEETRIEDEFIIFKDFYVNI